MTLTSIGFTGTVDQVAWAKLNYAQDAVNSFEGVATSSFSVQASVSAVRSVVVVGPAVFYACGVRVDLDASTAIAHSPLAAGQTSRLDYGVLQLDWSTKTASLVAVEGSPSAYKTLTRNPGVLWQMPLYSVTLSSSNNGLFADATVIDRFPRPRLPRVVRAPDWASKTIAGSATAGVEITSLVFEDPGWPYTLDIVARQSFDQGDESGTATLAVLMSSTELARNNGDGWPGDTPSGEPDGPIHEVIEVSYATDAMTGRGTLHLMAIPRNVATNGSIVAEATNANAFYFRQIPA